MANDGLPNKGRRFASIQMAFTGSIGIWRERPEEAAQRTLSRFRVSRRRRAPVMVETVNPPVPGLVERPLDWERVRQPQAATTPAFPQWRW
jgi:hypothetical protein